MIVLDANILLHAYDSSSPLHPQALPWLEELFSTGDAIGLPWQTVAAFLRVVTNPKLRGGLFTVEEAMAIVNQWLAQPNIRLLAPGDRHWTVLQSAMLEGQAHAARIRDAQLAARTMEYGGLLHTTDRDFARFPQLRRINPFRE